LHPEYPPEGIATEELDRRYGGRAWRDRLYAMFDDAGLPYSREITHVPNSRRAQQLIELARDRGRHGALHRRVMDAYWHRARDIGDPAVLREEATAAGLDAGEVDDVLAGDRYLDRLEAETRALHELGGGGVPAWVIDDRVLVPGAQPHEVFERAIERLRGEEE
ncbi:MAG TPA: DsbA family protein, partial [Solirubrobacteraceae bacterium]|nr:DsbA family protein [Solirubrobacteraceae bacterium]